DGSAAALLGARLRSGAVSLGAELAVHAIDRQAVQTGAIELARGDIAFAGCAHRAWLAACGTLGVGVVRGHGRDLVISRSATLPLVGAGVRLATEWPLGSHLALRLHLEGRLLA